LFVKIQGKESRGKEKNGLCRPLPLLLEWQNKFGRIEFEQNQWRDTLNTITTTNHHDI
jgi:hypothetical protein